MVSSPNFDPANPPSDLDTDQSGKYEGVYLNKALSSTYTPGSIFKLVTTAAAIENIPNIEQRTFQCTGKTVINGREITCDSVHGTINYRDGLAKSCNIVFADLAVELGKNTMTKTANAMGFNKVFHVESIILPEKACMMLPMLRMTNWLGPALANIRLPPIQPT